VNGGSITDQQDERREDTEGADEAFQAGLLSEENLFMGQSESSLALLILNDGAQEIIAAKIRP